MLELRLYTDDSDVALMNGADRVVELEDLAQAIQHGRDLIQIRLYQRAIVVDEDEQEHFDSHYDLAGPLERPLPVVAAPGPRSRVSPLAERPAA